MAVVVGNFTKERGLAKANIRYIQQRPGIDREKRVRVLFGSASIMGREEAYQLIDDEAAGNPFFYRFKLSPDPKREDTNRDLDMHELTRSVMDSLEKRLNTPIPWVGALHDDHSLIRHIHLLAILPKRLHIPELTFLIQEATEACTEQRRALDAGREQATGQHQASLTAVKTPSAYNQTPSASRTEHPKLHILQDNRPSSSPPPTCTCPRCRFTQTHNRRHHTHECVSCGLMLHPGKQLKLQRKEAPRERSR